MRPIVIIPARGGSKGLVDKNILPLNGVPLIHYTIHAARKVFSDEIIFVSTDSEKIQAVAEQTGISVPFLRPAELASDTASSIDVLFHVLNTVENNGYSPDTIILLQPTSPFRTESHIRGAMEIYDDKVDMVVSVTESHSNPYYGMFEDNADGFLVKVKEGNYTRRQDCPKVWQYNGAIYIIRVNSLREYGHLSFPKIRRYEMPQQESIDIDTITDFLFAEFLVTHQNTERNTLSGKTN